MFHVISIYFEGRCLTSILWKNQRNCLFCFEVMIILVNLIGDFFHLTRQSWPKLLGHLTSPLPCTMLLSNKSLWTWCVHVFIATLDGGGGRSWDREGDKLCPHKYLTPHSIALITISIVIKVSQVFLAKIVLWSGKNHLLDLLKRS